MSQSAGMNLCWCGCGQTTELAPRTHRRYGHIKGQPMRYVRGHNRLHLVNRARNAAETDIMQRPCACGCGQYTKIADHTERRAGMIKGRPMLYLRGHNRRGTGKPKPIRAPAPLQPKIIIVRAPKVPKVPEPEEPERQCACGCGGAVKGTAMRLFIAGHEPRKFDRLVIKPKPHSRARRIWLEEQAKKANAT